MNSVRSSLACVSQFILNISHYLIVNKWKENTNTSLKTKVNKTTTTATKINNNNKQKQIFNFISLLFSLFICYRQFHHSPVFFFFFKFATRSSLLRGIKIGHIAVWLNREMLHATWYHQDFVSLRRQSYNKVFYFLGSLLWIVMEESTKCLMEFRISPTGSGRVGWPHWVYQWTTL